MPPFKFQLVLLAGILAGVIAVPLEHRLVRRETHSSLYHSSKGDTESDHATSSLPHDHPGAKDSRPSQPLAANMATDHRKQPTPASHGLTRRESTHGHHHSHSSNGILHHNGPEKLLAHMTADADIMQIQEDVATVVPVTDISPSQGLASHTVSSPIITHNLRAAEQGTMPDSVGVSEVGVVEPIQDRDLRASKAAAALAQVVNLAAPDATPQAPAALDDWGAPVVLAATDAPTSPAAVPAPTLLEVAATVVPAAPDAPTTPAALQALAALDAPATPGASAAVASTPVAEAAAAVETSAAIEPATVAPIPVAVVAPAVAASAATQPAPKATVDPAVVAPNPVAVAGPAVTASAATQPGPAATVAPAAPAAGASNPVAVAAPAAAASAATEPAPEATVAPAAAADEGNGGIIALLFKLSVVLGIIAALSAAAALFMKWRGRRAHASGTDSGTTPFWRTARSVKLGVKLAGDKSDSEDPETDSSKRSGHRSGRPSRKSRIMGASASEPSTKAMSASASEPASLSPHPEISSGRPSNSSVSENPQPRGEYSPGRRDRHPNIAAEVREPFSPGKRSRERKSDSVDI